MKSIDYYCINRNNKQLQNRKEQYVACDCGCKSNKSQKRKTSGNKHSHYFQRNIILCSEIDKASDVVNIRKNHLFVK